MLKLKKIRARFGAFKKDAELSEMLVTLERHAPIEIPPIEELAPFENTDAAAKYFEKMGFATLLKRILYARGGRKDRSEEEPKNKVEAQQQSDVAFLRIARGDAIIEGH